MSYSAEVEFLDDCLWSGGNNLMGWDGSFAHSDSNLPLEEVFASSFMYLKD